ncbi:glycosyltransferase involved in cell wall biosynthesis [Sphingobium sp. B7D2B]|uniref:glycosyltransferase family 4 protein n=1 Tax=Sphingobium sp. B7D2B TaxID=2940583 RepID=UPI002224C6D1|nr:glycosyltransferase family 1 protein [Sphingobium sp. B7D2B]MCW2366808.1 glycosyltransferase involved in cell wall biosynthesis [Sphingobium sp. B7D2B]
MKDKSRVSYLLDVSRLVWRAWRGQLPTGIDRTCLAYVRHYRRDARAVVQRGNFTRILCADASRRLFDCLLAPGREKKAALLHLAASAFLTSRANDVQAQFYLNVGHTGLDRAGHMAWIARTSVRPIYFVHDLIPLTHPEYCRSGEPEKHLKRMTSLLTHGAGIIANSGDTLDQLAIFAGHQKPLDMVPTLVALLGADGQYSTEMASSGDWVLPARPYFVLLGTIEGRKNHLLILNIWAEMVRRLGAECPLLIIIGRRGWECEQVVDMLERCEVLRGHIVELPHCSDAQLSAYLVSARALLFPSFAEGYGLPLVEALSHGTPVLASDLAVFREVAGDVPDYLSPIDGLGWMRAIEDYTVDGSVARSAQVERISGWTAPTWQAHFDLVDCWLAQLN